MWQEIRFEIDQSAAESIADALLEAGALSVIVEDADAESIDEQPLFGEPGLQPETTAWRRNRLMVLLPQAQAVEPLVTRVFEQAKLPQPVYSTRFVEEQDWVSLTQAQFEPIQISSRLWIVPSWHPAPDQAEALVLRLDPGLAFGTGTHPTTRVCLRWLEQHLQTDQTLLDYGCGSGILALAACKLGAAEVWGVDIDPQAVQVAQQNSAANACEARFVLPDDLPEQKFSVVVANILSNPLKLLAPMLCARVEDHGFLVLSGILVRQADELIAIYSPYMTMNIWAEDEGWLCLVGQKI